MTQPILFQCAHGAGEPERATLPFVAANVAANAGQPAIVLCTMDRGLAGDAGWGRCRRGERPSRRSAPLIREFVANGGAMWLCGTCTNPRGITEAQLAAGACIVGAGRIVEAVISGASMVALS